MADIDAKVWLESVMLDEDDMLSDSATDVCTQQSIKKYVDDSVGAASFATESYVDTGDANTLSSANSYTDGVAATKQDNLTNGADALTTAEVDQVKNIDTTTISTTSWGVVGGLAGSPLHRIIDDNPSPAWPTAYIPITDQIDTSTTCGMYHFALYQDNGATSSDFCHLRVCVPPNCFYDGTSNPPAIHSWSSGLGTQKINKIIGSNDGTTNRLTLYAEIINNGDGILDLYTSDFATSTLGTRLTAGASASSLSSQTTMVYVDHHRWTNNYGNAGSVKIDSNGDTSEPTLTLVTGVPQQVIYTSPIIDPTSVFPQIGPQNSSCIWDPVNNIFLECPVIGQPQLWRISINYSGKASNNNTGFYVHLINPISGFTRRLLATLPSGETGNDFVTFDVTTYADTNSLAPPLGTGLGGYEFWVSSIDTGINVVIKDIARFTYVY